jgi:hypothetical protein
VDGVEIDPNVVEIARVHFGLKESAHQRLHVDDARRFLRSSPLRYDIISADLYLGMHRPYHLYTREFFSLVRQHLKPHGVFVALYEGAADTDDPVLTSFLKTAATELRSVFLTESSGAESIKDLLVHLSPDPDYRPDRSGGYEVIPVDPSMGRVLTDEDHYMDLIDSRNQMDYRLQTAKWFGGYAMFFAR